MDDILIQAPDYETLFSRIREVLEICQRMGLTISNRKLAMGESVNFAGFTVGAVGITPDPSQVASLRDFPSPTDVTGL